MIIFFNCITIYAIREEKKIIESQLPYFCLFLNAKNENMQNYGGVGSQYGGAGRISLLQPIHFK